MSHLVRAAALTAALAVAPAAHAVTLYWDNDANPVGNTVSNTGGTGLGGTGTWNTTDLKWWDGVSSDVAWTDGNDALFYGNATYTVTQSGNFAPNSLTFGVGAGNVIITGGTLTLNNPGSDIVMKTNESGAARTQIIRSVISGTDITVDVPFAPGINSFLTIGANPTGVTNTFTGDLIFAGANTTNAGSRHQIAIDNPTALPATATIRMKRNICQLLFGGLGGGQVSTYTATFNNNIILNDGGSGTFTQGIAAGAAGTEITLGGVISGNANLVFELGAGGGRGLITLANKNTYTGNTNLNGQVEATIRLGIDNALPVGTMFILNRGRAFDLAGFDQRVGGITNTGANTSAITNSHATNVSTLTIDGNVTGTYPGHIGSIIAAAPTLIGNSNIELVLAPTNTGRLTLSRQTGSDYSGGTTIGGGTLIAASDASGGASATGTGPVAVNNGGTLGGGGGVGGAITVASGGRIAPSNVFNSGTLQSGAIGTLSAFSSVSLGSGSRLDMDLGSPAPAGGTSDRLHLSGGTLTVPGAAASVGVNLTDPAGGAAGNGTYTLLSFPVGQYSGTNASQFFTSALPIPNSLNGATITYQLADDSNVNQNGNASAATRVNMIVTGGPNALVWTGAVNGTWDVGSPPSPFNFNNLNTASGAAFANNDNVTFNDTGANTNPITVAAGGVQPNIVTINNSSTTYAFSGGDIKGSSVGGGGGLFLGGTGTVTIDSNYTAAGPITSNKTGTGAATFNGAITAATSLTVNGGAVTLAGANTYAGNNIVNAGTLTASGASARFGTGNLTVNAGSAVISAGVVDAISNLATLTLLGGGTANMADAGFISLASGVNEQVAALILGAAPQVPGTYGATGSGATNINDEYFSGMGIISVGTPGDYNGDGKVNAADYVLWRKNPGAFGGPGGYDTWRANFGNPPGSGSSFDGSAVPEPAACWLSILMICSLLSVRRGKR